LKRSCTCHSSIGVRSRPTPNFAGSSPRLLLSTGQLIGIPRRSSLLDLDNHRTGVPSVRLKFKSSQIPSLCTCDRLFSTFSTLVSTLDLRPDHLTEPLLPLYTCAPLHSSALNQTSHLPTSRSQWQWQSTIVSRPSLTAWATNTCATHNHHTSPTHGSRLRHSNNSCTQRRSRLLCPPDLSKDRAALAYPTMASQLQPHQWDKVLLSRTEASRPKTYLMPLKISCRAITLPATQHQLHPMRKHMHQPRLLILRWNMVPQTEANMHISKMLPGDHHIQ